MTGKIETGMTKSGKFFAISPYNKEFIEDARNLNGSFGMVDGKKAWVFDPRDEERVREALIEAYGTDGDLEVETVSIRIDLDELSPDSDSIELKGIQLVKKWSRDRRPKLEDNVVVVDGGFKQSGGSRKYPRITYKSGTVIEARDIPLSKAEEIADEYPSSVTIVVEDNDDELSATERDILKRLRSLDEERRELILSELEA